MMRRDPEKMAAGIEELVARVKGSLGGKRPAAVLQMECLARGKHMFREEEKMTFLEKIQGPFTREIPWIGFFCSGEIAPVRDLNFMHNYTTVLSVIA
jgi:small ligand-binding sensory domain FIST